MSNKVSFIIIAKDAFSVVANRVSKSAGKMKKSFAGIGKDLKKLTKRFAQLAGAILSYVSVTNFFKKGMAFQDSIAELSAITGASGENLKYLSDQAMDMGKRTARSAVDVSEAFKLIASAKSELLKDPKGLVKVTDSVILLANASGVDLDLAANTVARSLNQFGASAESALKYVDILAAGAKFGASEIIDTASAVVLAGSATRAAGMDFLTLNSALQGLAQGGIIGAKAGNALNAIFTKLRIQGYDFEKDGMVGVLEKVKAKLDRIKNSTRRAKMEFELFGLEHGKTGLILLNQIEFMKQMNKELLTTGVASEQAKRNMATFSTKIRRVGTIIDNSMIKVFLKLEESDTFSKMAEDFGKWADQLDDTDIKKMAETVKALADSFVMVAKGVALAFGALKSIGTWMGTTIGKLVVGHQKTVTMEKWQDKVDAGEMSKAEYKIAMQQLSGNFDVNLNAPPGVVESTKSSTVGNVKMNVGLNNAPEVAAQ